MIEVMENNPIMKWLGQNLLNIVILSAGMLLAWAALNARVNAIEAKVAEYPSQDYFDLKFQTIDKSIADLEKKVDANTLIIGEGIVVVPE